MGIGERHGDGEEKKSYILRSDNGACETVTAIKADTVSTCGTVNLDLSSIRLELFCWVLSRDTALDGETSRRDAVLSETKLWQGRARSNLDLSSNDINASDLLGNGVLDLDSGVDLDEVITVLLVNQELSGTGIAVVHRLRQLHGIVEDGLANILRQILCGRKLNNLLMSALDGAVTLVQVHDVSVVVSEELDLNVLWLVEEALDEHCAVAEGGLSLGCGSIKRLLQRRLLADYTHTTATTTISCLDDDWEAIFVGKFLDILEPLNRTLGTRYDRDARLDRKGSGGNLVSESIDNLWGRANELDYHMSVTGGHKMLSGGDLR